MTQDFNPTRRRALQGALALAVTGAMPLAARAQSKQIVVSDPGGPYTTAYREAFYDPFEKATGIKVVSVARESQPVAQFAAMVQTKNYVWDVTTLTLSTRPYCSNSERTVESVAPKLGGDLAVDVFVGEESKRGHEGPWPPGQSFMTADSSSAARSASISSG